MTWDDEGTGGLKPATGGGVLCAEADLFGEGDFIFGGLGFGGDGGEDGVADHFDFGFPIDDLRLLAEVEAVLDFDVGNFVGVELDFACGGEAFADGGNVPAIVADDVKVLAGAEVNVGYEVVPIFSVFDDGAVDANGSSFHLGCDFRPEQAGRGGCVGCNAGSGCKVGGWWCAGLVWGRGGRDEGGFYEVSVEL